MTTAYRIVHLGLGNFHRAHQAWWTAAVAEPAEWQICAYSGRRPDLVARMNAQQCRYTVVERGPEGDRFEPITTITEATDGRDTDHLQRRLADPATRIVTLTVTEAGYHLRPDGRLDLDAAPIRADRAAIANNGRGLAPGGVPATPAGALQTPAGRLLLGLRTRQRVPTPGRAVVTCATVPAMGSDCAVLSGHWCRTRPRWIG